MIKIVPELYLYPNPTTSPSTSFGSKVSALKALLIRNFPVDSYAIEYAAVPGMRKYGYGHVINPMLKIEFDSALHL